MKKKYDDYTQQINDCLNIIMPEIFKVLYEHKNKQVNDYIMTKDLLCSIVLTTILNVVDINERIGIVASLDMIKEINSALVENILERVANTKAEPILLQDTLQ